MLYLVTGTNIRPLYRRALIADSTKPKTPKGLYIYRWQLAQVPTLKGLYVRTLVEHKTPSGFTNVLHLHAINI